MEKKTEQLKQGTPQALKLEEINKLYTTSEKVAREIRMLSRAFKKMGEAGLKRETIVLLLHASSNVGKPDIRAILMAIDNLERDYTK